MVNYTDRGPRCKTSKVDIQLHYKHLYISERLPRPDEILQYEKSFRNVTKISPTEDRKNASGCQAFTECQEKLANINYVT